jgi:sugar-specific transcriptional regulator TrmB
MDTTILEDLGLTSAEAKIYIALLELGSSGANPILSHSGLQNSVVHRALNSLIEKGLVSFIMNGNRKVYQATEPDYFYSFIDNKKKKFDQIFPELKKRKELLKSKTEATIYQGKKGISEIYGRLLNSGGKEYLTFGGGKRVTYEVMGEDWWTALHTKRISKKIRSRQVFDDTIRKFGEALNKRPLSNIRFLSQEFEQLTETVIIGEYVAIVMFTEAPYGLLIKDPVVVESYRKNFEILWEKAKK